MLWSFALLIYAKDSNAGFKKVGVLVCVRVFVGGVSLHNRVQFVKQTAVILIELCMGYV